MNILIVKTGSTIQPLLDKGLDFENWFADGLQIPIGRLFVCDPSKGEPLPDIERISGLIITGSPAYVTDEAPWNFLVADYCKNAIKLSKPILGVCYGHQLLAWALGGRVGFNPNGREIGTSEISLTGAAKDDSLFTDLPEQISVQVSHQQSVLQLPDNAVLLASNAIDPHHAYRIGETTWGIQFHPEFTAETTRAYIAARADDIQKENLNPEALIRGLRASPESASLLPRFVELVERKQKS